MTRVDDVRIGLLGLGTVGAGVVKILAAQRPMLEERAGCRLTLAAIADTDLVRAREGLDLKALPMVGDAAKVLAAAREELEIEPEYLELRSTTDLSPVERVNGSTLLAVAQRRPKPPASASRRRATASAPTMP